MKILNLETTTNEHKILKDYLENNVSELLADKINNSVKIEKDGKVLLNKKDLTTFLHYASEEARKLAEKGARFACVDDATVFSWAIHYFEEDALIGKLYNEDGTEYKPPKPVYNGAKANKPVAPALAPKPKPQMSMFDLMTAPTEAVATHPPVEPTIVETLMDDEPAYDNLDNESAYDGSDDDEANIETEEVLPPKNVLGDKYIDEDGIVHNYSPPLFDEPVINTTTHGVANYPPSDEPTPTTATPSNTTTSTITVPPAIPPIATPSPATSSTTNDPSTTTTAPTVSSTTTPPNESSNSDNEILHWLHSIFGDNIKAVL